jgi:hypothetical protein
MRQRIEKSARFPKLAGTRTLCEIAGNDDHVRLELLDRPPQRFEDLCVDAAEVKVRQMDDGAHDLSTLASKAGARARAALQA